MNFKSIYILLLSIWLASPLVFAQKNTSVKLLTTKTEFTVGSHIVLKFKNVNNNTPLLYCSNSYGTTLVSGTINNLNLEYTLPENIAKKIGVINWKILDKNYPTSGKLYIKPKAEVATMETYIGPPSIEAGGTDYSMLVVIPTDSLDNPVPTNTPVKVKNQFLNSEEVDNVFTKNLIAFKNIYSKKQDGRILVSSEALGTNSKEFTINAMPAVPTRFKISYSSPHNYADGNQITNFTTSVIKDRFNNVVSDGTYVDFFIKNAEGNILKTSGLTLNGVANSKIIHPDHADNWSVKAYINGMAESNIITLNYKQVVKDFNVAFTNKNRTISVGPLQSFMNQMIPDGLHVKLYIYSNNQLVKILTKTTFNGYVYFNLKPAIYKNNNYNFKIETAGITKQFNKKLW
ncbi:hypothetical protein LG651_06950 [Tamlana sp. 62-3]|uniref:Uncharacterized protein n=1 Tax=Neotamlana sargassicola TaxID=2883125 RepID=A0A9X1I513_9FLAO|nr:hypothetical protein [Tamlana sargassicola]MCB4807986.1 hypothetical protein [Tamlana sargassicola]